MENSSAKPLLSPMMPFSAATVGSAKRSSSWQTSSSNSSINLSQATNINTHINTHSKLRASRSFDTRTAAADTASGFETGSTAYRDEVIRPGVASTAEHELYSSYRTQDPLVQQQMSEPPRLVRVQSARDRPTSAWKSRRSGRQPNFTFTDLGGRVADASRSGSARVPACPPESRSNSVDLENGDSRESMHRLRLTNDDNGGSNGDDGDDWRTSVHARQPLYRHEVGAVVQAHLPVYNGSAAGFDRRRRHSLYAPPPSIEISGPTQATVLSSSPPTSDSSNFSGDHALLDGGRTSRLESSSPDEISDGNASFRSRALTDGEHSAARKRVLARLTGIGTDQVDDEAASNTCRTQLPRKLNPLFHN